MKNDGYQIVLGFDVSSSCIGWCSIKINNSQIEFLDCGYLKPIKDGSIIERIVDTRNKIQKIIKNIKPNYIAIENIIQFMQGKSTAKTIIMLTTFNRMIGLTSYDYLGEVPTLYSVMTIRHGLKTSKDLPKKEDIPALVAKHLGITFPYEYNKNGKIKIENFDKADGMAVALYHAFALTGKVKSKSKDKKK